MSGKADELIGERVTKVLETYEMKSNLLGCDNNVCASLIVNPLNVLDAPEMNMLNLFGLNTKACRLFIL